MRLIRYEGAMTEPTQLLEVDTVLRGLCFGTFKLHDDSQQRRL
jgi:hypothetical protein